MLFLFCGALQIHPRPTVQSDIKFDKIVLTGGGLDRGGGTWANLQHFP